MQPFRKYKNTKVEVDGHKFDSKLESNLYLTLKKLKLDFTLQPKYVLVDSFKLKGITHRAIVYRGDFDLKINDVIYTIDTKGMETQVFKLKKKLFALRYQREIVIIKSIKHFMEWYKGVINNV